MAICHIGRGLGKRGAGVTGRERHLAGPGPIVDARVRFGYVETWTSGDVWKMLGGAQVLQLVGPYSGSGRKRHLTHTVDRLTGLGSIDKDVAYHAGTNRPLLIRGLLHL